MGKAIAKIQNFFIIHVITALLSFVPKFGLSYTKIIIFI